MEFCLVGYGPVSQLNADTTKGASCFDTCGPVGVAICNPNKWVVVRSLVQEEVPICTVNGRERSVMEIVTWACSPVVDPIVACLVKVADSMLEAVVVVF